ncbi:hypothetical protein VSVS12_03643 [Vibrio scophthalmi]|nr:hypothetical protein VSVS12_03643 [Vibrio scophthalmi]
MSRCVLAIVVIRFKGHIELQDKLFLIDDNNGVTSLGE